MWDLKIQCLLVWKWIMRWWWGGSQSLYPPFPSPPFSPSPSFGFLPLTLVLSWDYFLHCAFLISYLLTIFFFSIPNTFLKYFGVFQNLPDLNSHPVETGYLLGKAPWKRRWKCIWDIFSLGDSERWGIPFFCLRGRQYFLVELTLVSEIEDLGSCFHSAIT